MTKVAPKLPLCWPLKPADVGSQKNLAGALQQAYAPWDGSPRTEKSASHTHLGDIRLGLLVARSFVSAVVVQRSGIRPPNQLQGGRPESVQPSSRQAPPSEGSEWPLVCQMSPAAVRSNTESRSLLLLHLVMQRATQSSFSLTLLSASIRLVEFVSIGHVLGRRRSHCRLYFGLYIYLSTVSCTVLSSISFFLEARGFGCCLDLV